MNQHSHRVPHVPPEPPDIARIWEEYGGLPHVFAVPADGPRRTGSVVAWGVELPDGTAITCDPVGSAFGTWESPISAAAMLGGTRPVYLTGPDAHPHA